MASSAASCAGDGQPGCSTRKPSQKHALKCMEALGTKQLEQDRETELQEIMKALRNTPEVVPQVKGIIKRHQEKHAPKKMARGVRTLKDVPEYIVRDVLVQITGVTASVFTNSATEAND
eukprot:4749072-Lingulodinium_polyedra.AAC.1